MEAAGWDGVAPTAVAPAAADAGAAACGLPNPGGAAVVPVVVVAPDVGLIGDGEPAF